MEIRATTPCYRFRDAKPEEQIAKFKEELAEVEEAYAKFKKTPTKTNLLALLVEIIDIEACAETFIYQLAKHHSKVELLTTDASNKVIAKNMYRGYYQTPEEAEEIAEKLNTNAAEPFKE